MNYRALAICAIFVATLGTRAWADPGMTWTQERAWLAANDYVDYKTIDKSYDKSVGVTVGTASIDIGRVKWVIHAVLDKNDVVGEETYTVDSGSSQPAPAIGGRQAQVLVQRMYLGEAAAQEYQAASQVATVSIYNDPGKEEFFAAQNGKFGFMLDPYEVVVFRNSELGERIKQAQYCSTHKECGQ